MEAAVSMVGAVQVSAATMAATANLGIGGYYDDDCYVVRRRVLTPFQSPFCERGDRASSRKMGWRIEATCRKRAAGRHGRLDALSKHHPWYPMKAFDGTKEMTSTQTKLVPWHSDYDSLDVTG
jgi:hypothetical protein